MHGKIAELLPKIAHLFREGLHIKCRGISERFRECAPCLKQTCPEFVLHKVPNDFKHDSV